MPPEEINDQQPELTISPETVCTVIMLAREFDAKDEVSEPDPGSNPTDDHAMAVLEDHEDDPVEEQLTGLIAALSYDEQVDLVALAWLGRDEHEAVDWDSVRQDAAQAHNRRSARYLRGMPLLADYLAEGLSLLGHSCDDYERAHL